MRNTWHLYLAAMLAAGSLGAADVAYASEETSLEKAELAQLSPLLRSNVEDRLISGQTVRGVLETMLLNNLSLDFATRRIVAADFQKGEAVVEGTNGEMRAFPFDVATLVIRK